MGLAPRSFRLLLLPVLIVLFIAGAVGFWRFYGQSYSVTVELPYAGTIEQYKDAEPSLRSPEVLAQFARVYGLDNSTATKNFEAELTRGASGPIRISHEFNISKASLRNVPDVLADSVVKNSVVNSSPSSSIVVAAQASAPDEAIGSASMAMHFVRYVLVQRGLARALEEWRRLGPAFAELDSQVLTARKSIESIDRTIAALKVLQNGEEGARVQPNSTVLLQVPQAPYFLPIDQQIRGMQAQRIAATEQLTGKEDELNKRKAVKWFGDQLAARISSVNDPLRALKLAEMQAEQFRSDAKSIPEQQAANQIRFQLASVRVVAVDVTTNPDQPVAVLSGFGLRIAVVIGVAAGGTTWLALLYLSFAWRPLSSLPKNEVGADFGRDDSDRNAIKQSGHIS